MKISWVVDPLSPLLLKLGHNLSLFQRGFFPLNGSLFVTNGKSIFHLKFKIKVIWFAPIEKA